MVSVTPALDTLRAENDVPAADAATNAKARDVIGQKGDAAVFSASAVASAIAYLKALLRRTPAHRRRSAASLTNPTSAAYVTLLSITNAAGILRFIKMVRASTATDSYIRFTVDGGTPIYLRIGAAVATYYLLSPPDAAATAEGSATSLGAEATMTTTETLLDLVRFHSSLLVEVKGNGADDFTAMAVYE